MKYIVFTNTPAHVHLYRNAVRQLTARGHDVLVLARDYGCTLELLDWYDLPYTVYGACDTSKGSLFRQLPRQYAGIVRRARRFDPDLIFGMGAYSAHAGLVTRTPTVLVLDSEPTSLDHAVSRPFAAAILTPAAFRKDLGTKHYVFDGFKESAYLHPDVRSGTDDRLRERLGLAPDERYALVRFNAFGSHHDVGEGGFTPDQRRTLVERLADEVTVFVSDEGDGFDLEAVPARSFDVHPALMHDAIDEASLLVADTQTIVTEAALLGTAVIRSNSFVGPDDMGNFQRLDAAGLACNIESFDAVVERAAGILADPSAADRWRHRRDEFVDSMVNLTEVIVAIATSGRIDDVSGVSRRGGATDDAHPTILPGTGQSG